MEILTLVCLVGIGIAFLTEGKSRSRRSKRVKEIKAHLATFQESVDSTQSTPPPLRRAVALPSPALEPEPDNEGAAQDSESKDVPMPQATGAMIKMPPPAVPAGQPAPTPVGTGALPQTPSQRFATTPNRTRSGEKSDEKPESAEALAAMMVLEMQKELRRNFWRGIFKDIIFFALGVATPFAINAMAGSN